MYFKIPRLYQSVDMDLDMLDLVKSVLNKKSFDNFNS